ncbi:hypothetical protein L3Q67_45035 (plasmid) [Saccharothrix sp. AJ9571]|nr:hypothetical protein L3Q67_45035 [Saccharothrix sp. AJ9571]
MNAYQRLARPPLDQLDPRGCEYLAFEDGQIITAINTRAAELYATYSGAAAFLVTELRDLARLLQARQAAYTAAARPSPTPRPATPPARKVLPAHHKNRRITMSADDRWTARIRDAIIDLELQPGDWVGLVDLRPMLAPNRSDQDKHLKRLSAEGQLHLAPESNRKALQDTDHAAAVRLGGDDCHLVQWVGPR